jgi:hypothetical protein
MLKHVGFVNMELIYVRALFVLIFSNKNITIYTLVSFQWLLIICVHENYPASNTMHEEIARAISQLPRIRSKNAVTLTVCNVSYVTLFQGCVQTVIL